MIKCNGLLSAILNVMHLDLYRQGREAITILHHNSAFVPEEERSSLLDILQLWTNPFSTLQVLVNRETPLHCDVRGHSTWFDMLVTLRRCQNGRLEFPGLRLQLDYLPGKVVGITSKVITHGVGKVNGDWVCLAYFMRNKVLERLGISAGTWMTCRN
jgi:hypothetical protein